MTGDDTGTPSVDGSRQDFTSCLADRFADWCREPIARHVLALVVLMAVVALRWWRYTFAPVPQNDESIYFEAFAAVARGDSPYTPTGYLTFSFLAYVGGWGLEHLGRMPTLAILLLAALPSQGREV